MSPCNEKNNKNSWESLAMRPTKKIRSFKSIQMFHTHIYIYIHIYYKYILHLYNITLYYSNPWVYRVFCPPGWRHWLTPWLPKLALACAWTSPPRVNVLGGEILLPDRMFDAKNATRIVFKPVSMATLTTKHGDY